jgi:hypothetical protein
MSPKKLAAMIRLDLSKVDGCPRTPFGNLVKPSLTIPSQAFSKVRQNRTSRAGSRRKKSAA